MPEGFKCSRYALEVDGVLTDAVAVPNKKAAEVEYKEKEKGRAVPTWIMTDASDGGGEDDVDIFGCQSCVAQRLLDRLGPHLYAHLDEGIIGLAEGQAWVRLERKGEVARSDLHGAMQLLEPVSIVVVLRPVSTHGLDEDRLFILVLGKSTAHRSNVHGVL